MRTKYKDKTFLRGVGYCLEGIAYTFRDEKNFRIEVIIGILVVIASFIFKISLIEWIIVIFLITMVLVLELINTAFESMVDLYTQKYNEMAKATKDVIAGAVLVTCLFSFVIGMLIFVPRVLEVIK